MSLMARFFGYLIGLPFIFQVHGAYNPPEAQIAAVSGEYKKAIELCEKEIEEADKKTISSLKVKLAIAFYKDQEQQKSFTQFLEALETALPLPSQRPNQEEETLYKEGLELYLHRNKTTSSEISIKIREHYAEVICIHPDYYVLKYLVALAYANLEQFEQFFTLFYQSYLYFPKHYLAYKTKAILHAKLLEKTASPEEREKRKLAIYHNLTQAVSLYPQDITLYKMMITAAPEKNRSAIIQTSINKILEENIVVPRLDLIFYIEQAVQSNELDLAQSFINKTQVWYPGSRMVKHAQCYLDAHKFKKKAQKNE